jgi:flagellar hook-basal body complex protein FliE
MDINLAGLGAMPGGVELRPVGSGGGSQVEAGLAFGQQLADTLRFAEQAAMNTVAGQGSLQETVATVLEAERTLSAAVAIRDKIVSAYLELSRMQV